MPVESPRSWIDELSLSDARSPEVYLSLGDIDSAPLQLAHILRQAWTHLELDAILCTGTQVVAYIKECDDNDEEARAIHQKAWGQGVSPIIILVTPHRIKVFSCLALPTARSANVASSGRVLHDLNRTADILEAVSIVRRLRMGTYFEASEVGRTYRTSFDPKLRVDRYLLTNLNQARKELEVVSEGFNKAAVHRLLGRVIFACYLIDRGIVDSDYLGSGASDEPARSVADILNGVAGPPSSALFNLFRRMRADFNGDMFAGDIDEEELAFTEDHVAILRGFLMGENLVEKQPTLGFWAYDFSIIPIETLSAIYESFLEADDRKAKKQVGAYYTPRFLCEVVLDQVLARGDGLLGKRFLDPACGSGIFLVSLLNRMAEEWKRRNKGASNEETFGALVDIVQTSLFGVDLNETACRITALSLYLAILDHLDPRDIRRLPPRALPNLVRPIASEGVESGNNIVHCDFFNSALPSDLRDFDFVIGNPPWARMTHSLMARWCAERGFPIAQGQMAHGFVWKALTHLKPEGSACFLLPAGVLFNQHPHATEFQRALLQSTVVEDILNFSDLCFYLFENAIRPAISVTYRKGTPALDHRIDYAVPKTDPETLRADLLDVSWIDRHEIPQKELLATPNECLPDVWKRRMWASPRDRELLSTLDGYPKLAAYLGPETPLGKSFTLAGGFQPLGPNDDRENCPTANIPPGSLFLDAADQATRLIIHPNDCLDFEEGIRRFRRWPTEDAIFESPHVVVSRALRGAFLDFPCYFQHAWTGIHGSADDQDALKWLAILLDSDLMKYYFFHTSSSWAVERHYVGLNELPSAPFWVPGKGDEGYAIYRSVVGAYDECRSTTALTQFGRREIISGFRQSIQASILDFFGLSNSERILVRDSLELWEPSSTPSRNEAIRTYAVSTKQMRDEYTALLLDRINGLSGDLLEAEAEVIVSDELKLGVIVLTTAPKRGKPWNFVETKSDMEMDQALRRIRSSLADEFRTLRQIRDIKVFSEDRLYLFKPLVRRHWARSIALADADEIAGAILFEKRGLLS